MVIGTTSVISPIVRSKDSRMFGTTATGVELVCPASVVHLNLGVLGTNCAGEFEFILQNLFIYNEVQIIEKSNI